MIFRQLPSMPASPRKRVPRALALVLLGLQALLWGGGPIAEARTAAESLYRYSHVEDQASTTCPPLRDGQSLGYDVAGRFRRQAGRGSQVIRAAPTDPVRRQPATDVKPRPHRSRSTKEQSREPHRY